MECAAQAGDPHAVIWLPGLKAEAGHQELLRAANIDRIRVPTKEGPRDTPIRGSVPVRSAEQMWRQRSLFRMMAIGQYRDWLASTVRTHVRDDGVIAAHVRVHSKLIGFPDDMLVVDALAQLSLSWEDLMEDAA